MGRLTPHLASALALAALVLLPKPAAANGIVRDSLGAVSSGRGGANVAHQDNLSIIHDNPAGLGWLEGSFALDVGADFLSPQVRYGDLDDSDSSRWTFFGLPLLGLATKSSEWPLSFGIIAAMPGGYGARYKLEHDSFGRQIYRSDGGLLKVLPTVALKLGDVLSIGAGVGLGYSQAKFRMPYTFNSGAFAGQSALVDLDSDGYGVTANLGVQLRPTDRWTIGAAYISQTLAAHEGSFKVDIRGTPLSGLVTDPDASYDAEFNMRWPMSATVGSSYEFESSRLSLEGTWYNWHDAFDELHLRLSDGDNPEFNALAGSEPIEFFPLEWRDSLAIHLGYELFLGAAGTLRCGYIFNLNTIPNGTLTPILPGVLEHSVSVGYGLKLGPWQADVAYQFAFATERKVDTSRLAGDDFDSSSLKAEAHWAFVTFGVRF